MHCSEYEAESLCLLSNLSKRKGKRSTMNYDRVTQTLFFPLKMRSAHSSSVYCSFRLYIQQPMINM